MTDQTPDAARDAVRNLTAVGHKYECASVQFIKHDRHSGLDQYGTSGKPCDCGAHAKRESTLDTYAAAVSRSRDAEWREAVESLRQDAAHHGKCFGAGSCDECLAVADAERWNAALSALLARMDTARAGGANG